MAEGRLDAGAFVRALPTRGDLVMISFDRGEPLPLPAQAMAAALDAGRRGRDLVVVDLPRHLDDAAVAALQAADHVFLVVPAELRATAAATVVAKAAAAHCADAVGGGPRPGAGSPAAQGGGAGASASRWPATCAPIPRWGAASSAARHRRPAAAGRWPTSAAGSSPT